MVTLGAEIADEYFRIIQPVQTSASRVSAGREICVFLGARTISDHRPAIVTMFDDQDLGFFASFLGIFIFVLVIAYHYVMADPKYEGN
uniref:Dolichyl-diphosphooligosaccharide--protein glycosyltransferase subunit 4A n=2 Tax=Nelumbo nucifera TaxID=4432 RepID=A0A822ZXP9_NELNU|nr:TPA_asm: hypothetical protein HUJ06_017906 [Nelumbo nucifera]